jgi:hypothetical protein
MPAGEEPPAKIARFKAAVLEALAILDLHGRMRLRRRESVLETWFIFTVAVRWPRRSVTAREEKREALRSRG